MWSKRHNQIVSLLVDAINSVPTVHKLSIAANDCPLPDYLLSEGDPNVALKPDLTLIYRDSVTSDIVSIAIVELAVALPSKLDDRVKQKADKYRALRDSVQEHTGKPVSLVPIVFSAVGTCAAETEVALSEIGLKKSAATRFISAACLSIIRTSYEMYAIRCRVSSGNHGAGNNE